MWKCELSSISTWNCHIPVSFVHIYTNFYFIMQEVRPTAFVGVPRVWEKFKEKVESQLRETTGIKEFILSKARVRGKKMCLSLFLWLYEGSFS